MTRPRTLETLRGVVNDVVKRQIDAGIDIVDDGEMGKASWITYLYERVGGLEARVMNVEGASMMPPSRDRQAVSRRLRGARRARRGGRPREQPRRGLQRARG